MAQRKTWILPVLLKKNAITPNLMKRHWNATIWLAPDVKKKRTIGGIRNK
jgi:hypothetical protein